MSQISQRHFPKNRLSQQGMTQTSLHVPAIRSRATGARHRHKENLQIKPFQVVAVAFNEGWHAWATTRKADAIRFRFGFDLLFCKMKVFPKRK